MKSNGELNKVEIWIADHAVPIFIGLAVAIIIGAGAVVWTYQKAGDAEQKINVLQPKIINGAAKCTAQSLVDDKRAKECAARLRIGLVNCRRSQPCRAAFLAVLTYPPPARGLDAAPALPTEPSSSGGGDAFQPSNHGHQPPGPATGPSPSPSPSPAPAPSPAPSPASPPEKPGNGPPGGSPPGQSATAPSGVGVEVCALSKCVEADVDPKGLLP